jgi:Ca2+-binding RTX toxin-like protein
MPHVFDYSLSGAGIFGADTGLSNLFMMNSGTALAAEFWNPTGFLTEPISYLAPTGQYDQNGNPILQTITTPIFLDSYGTRGIGPGDPYYYSGNPDLIVPASFDAGRMDLTIAQLSFDPLRGGQFLRFEDLPSIARSFGTGPRGLFADYGAASDGMLALVADANSVYLNQLQAMDATSLSDVGRIFMESWVGNDLPARMRLTYTPDANTRLTVGDIVTHGVQDGGYGYTSDIGRTDRMFGTGEDVTVILTRFDDSFGDSSGFLARTLRIDGGAGTDTINITGGGNLGGRVYLPLNVIINGDAGQDYIGVLVRRTATVSGGTGNDNIQVAAWRGDQTVRNVLSGGDGDDDVRGDGLSTLSGGLGNDFLLGALVRDVFYGGDGVDTIYDGTTYDNFTGNLGYSKIGNLVYGGAGADNVLMGNGDDSIFGGAGSDRLTALGGNDILEGGTGRDFYDVATENGLRNFLSTGHDIIRDNGGAILFNSFSAGGPFGSLAREDYIRVGKDLILAPSQNFGEQSSIRIVGFYLNPQSWNNAYLTNAGPTIDPDGPIDWDFAATLRAGRGGATAGNDRLFGLTGGNAINGLGGNDRIFGLSGQDTLIGSAGDDRLYGHTGNDGLYGGLGDDVLIGGAGADRLVGGLGADTLTGNAGADSFVFNSALDGRNIDRITTFSVRDDTIRLESEIFTGLGDGQLAVASFRANASGFARDSSDRIIYETDTGKLFFDADGLGGTVRVQFAQLQTDLVMSHADFFVI